MIRVAYSTAACAARGPRRRLLSIASASASAAPPPRDACLVDFSRCGAGTSAAGAAACAAALGVAVHARFLSASEEAALLAAAAAPLARRGFESGHWDGVIAGYREASLDLARAPEALRAAARRAHALFPRPAAPLLPQAHLLELERAGAISAHVDSVKFSGGVVAGICLASDAVMTLSVSLEAAAEAAGATAGALTGDSSAGAGAGASVRDPPAKDAPAGEVDILLPRGCLYVLSGEARYLWAHAIVAGAPPFRGAPVTRDRRVSIILRDELGTDSRAPRLAGSLAERVLREQRLLAEQRQGARVACA